MSAKRPAKVPTGASVLAQKLPESAVSRAVAELSASVNALPQASRSSVVVDLPVGSTRVAHGLGRIPTGVSVMPTTADATWAWAVTSRDARSIVVVTVGVAQDSATVEVW